MDAAPEAFPYRCLPLKIANSHGWELLSPVGFSVRWNGGPSPSDVEVHVDSCATELDRPVALFGVGTFTFHVPGIIRTSPGWSLWVGGPPNASKDGIVPLSGMIETDWSPYSFTMNWQLTRPNNWVRFEENEPICHFFPLQRTALEAIQPTLRSIDENPELKRQFERWSRSRDEFQARMRSHPPDRPSEKWQKLYYRGVDPDGVCPVADHRIRLDLAPFRGELGSCSQDGSSSAGRKEPRQPKPSAAFVITPDQAAPPRETVDRQLAKRDWLLGTLARQRSLSAITSGLMIYERPSPELFLHKHYAANEPALLRGLINHWPALHLWTPEYLIRRVGSTIISYQGDRRGDLTYEQKKEAHIREMPFDEFISVCLKEPSNELYLTAYNSRRNQSSLEPLQDDLGDIPGFIDAQQPFSGGMPWIGPAGTFTPLHHDLTNNLLIQICGKKRVILISPFYTPQLGNSVGVFSDIGDLEQPNLEEQHPEIGAVPFLSVEIGPGDALFVPVGWWHQVCSLSFSVSLTSTAFVWPNDVYASWPG